MQQVDASFNDTIAAVTEGLPSYKEGCLNGEINK